MKVIENAAGGRLSVRWLAVVALLCHSFGDTSVPFTRVCRTVMIREKFLVPPVVWVSVTTIDLSCAATADFWRGGGAFLRK